MTFPKDFIISDLYIANKLYSPSYVSLETALSNYSIIPEVAMAVTSITTKPTRSFKNKHGLFTYRTIQTHAFTGYYIEAQGPFSIFMAEPEKAVVDYLHFKTYQGKMLDLKADRFDREALAALKKRKMTRYARLYNLNLKDFYAYL